MSKSSSVEVVESGATTTDKMLEDEGDTWAQTVITVTPEEDAVLRELSPRTVVSAAADTSLVTNDIIYRRPFISTENLVLPPEVTRHVEFTVEAKDAQNQTHLQGLPEVRIPAECKDEASQTIYMSSPCPPLKYFRDIMTSMNEAPMPASKTTRKLATITTFDLETAHEIVVDELNAIIEEEKLRGVDLLEEEATETFVKDILEFVLTRAFWISDPASQRQLNCVDREAQTLLRYNCRLRTLVMDNDAQTGLTCEPKRSNSNLLSDYQDIRKYVQLLLLDYVDKGVDAKTVAHEITEEIIDKCAERIRYPMKDGVVQTVATYKLPCEKEEDVLRKLRIGVVVDPSEALIIVGPLIDDILESVCYIVSRDASVIVKWIVGSVLQKTEKIITKLLEIRLESQTKSVKEALLEKRRKIFELISKKSTESMSTQTFLAAVHEVSKIKDPQEVLCTLCRKKSPCYWCQVDSEEDVTPEETKPNRTQDILFAYKPCYVIATPSESKKYLYLPHTCLSEEKLKPALKPLQGSPREPRKNSNATVNVVFKCVKNTTSGDSSTGWSHVVDTALTKPWSMSDCASSTCKVAPTEKELTSQTQKCRQLPLQAQQALRILKDTFCTRDICTGPTRITKEVECTFNEAKIESLSGRSAMCPMLDAHRNVPKCQASKKMFCYCNHCDTEKHQSSQCSNFGEYSAYALSDSDSWKSLS